MKDLKGDEITEEEFGQLDAIEMLSILLRDSGARICFCTHCNHSSEFGYCWVCTCLNGQTAPPDLGGEGPRVAAAIEHMREILRDLAKTNKELELTIKQWKESLR